MVIPPAEAEPLNPPLSLAFVDDIELCGRSYNASRSPSLSPSPSLAFDSHYSRESGGSAPTCTPINSQQPRNHQIRYQGQNPSKTHENHTSDNHVQQLWLWEISSLIIAILAFTAIVITLVLLRDRPLPKWPSAITINALIAVFTAILKACLMMPIAECIGQLKWLWYQKSRPLSHIEQWDLASRGKSTYFLTYCQNHLLYTCSYLCGKHSLTCFYLGPWGSLLLVFILKGRHLVVLGALLTMSAMTIDPFTQQIIQFYSCSTVAKSEIAMVPYSNNYTMRPVSDSLPLDLQLQIAMYIGQLIPPANVSAALEFECRTGNCTFPSADGGGTFQSLALESRCTDLSSEITFSTEGILNTSFWTTIASLPALSTEKQLYGGFWAQVGQSDVMNSGDNPPGVVVDRLSSFLNRISYIMTHPDHPAEPQYTYAFECEFYPAVQTYSAIIKNGVLLEHVLNTQRMEVWVSEVEMRALLVVNRTIREGMWHDCTSSAEPTDEHNISVYKLEDPESTMTWWSQDCVFTLHAETMLGLSYAIGSLGATMSYNPTTKTFTGNYWSTKIYNNGTPTLDTIQTCMDGITRSLTAGLRQGNGLSINASPVYGEVWEIQTCVHVNWVWITLPAGLLLLTITFLFLTIIKTRLNQARVWKSSIFAVLFSGLDQDTKKADEPVSRLDEMKAAASGVMVRLENTEEGFRLVRQT